MRIGAPSAAATSVSGAIVSASPAIDCSRPGQCAAISASAARQRSSRSIAITFRALREQRPRQAAGAGADLDHGDASSGPRGAGDAAGQVEVEEEVLAERLLRREAVRGDDFAQRRQAVGGEAHGARRAASFSAAIRLVGLATPLPAMSNAVP